jgi:hypothetical protein
MGVDIVEFVMSVEEAFDLQFRDEDLQNMRTPRELIDHIAALLPRADASVDLTELAVTKLRDAISAECDVPVECVTPASSLERLLPQKDRHLRWTGVKRQLGLKKLPRIGISGCGMGRVLTLRQAAEYVAHYYPYSVKRGAGWSRSEIAEVVHWHMCNEFGLRRDQYTEDSRFVEDLKLE